MTAHVRAPFDYVRDPDAIYAQSFARIDEETEWGRVPIALRPVARRMIHACGMTDVVDDLAWSADFVVSATSALRAGAPILCDAQMLAHGIIERDLPNTNRVRCGLDLVVAAPAGTTRSAAAIDALDADIGGALVAIGNAPTALFRLLERAEEGRPQPAAVVALPVGFVGAAESKERTAATAPFPFLTLAGRRGGSAMAAAAVNALARLAAQP